MITLLLTITHITITNGVNPWVGVLVISLSGFIMVSIPTVSYQFAAEVTFPIDEVLAVGIMNTTDKLLIFALVRINV